MNRPYHEAYRSKLDTSLYMRTYSVSMAELGAKRQGFGGEIYCSFAAKRLKP
jgi:hypothetical protein